MTPIRSALALCAATAALCGGFAHGEALAPKSQERLPVASLSAPPALPRDIPATAPAPQPPPQAAQAAPDQYRISVSRVTPPSTLISQSAPATLTPAHFAPPEAPPADAAGEDAGACPPALQAARRGPPPPPPGDGHEAHYGAPPPPPPPPGPLDMAGLLAAQEIALGIRADQLDAWRAYAAAVVEMVDLDPLPPPKTPEPFGLSQALATHAVAEGKKAQVLLDARATLVARLSAPQLETAGKLTGRWPMPPQMLPPHDAPDARP